jgi:hypothetical protein
MDKDAKAIERILLDALKERSCEKHKKQVGAKVSLIGSMQTDPPLYISVEQRVSIQQLLMEFYRIMQQDKPQIMFSVVSQKFMQKFKIRSLEFLTVERFDDVIIELLNAIRSYHDMNFDEVEDDFVGFQVNEVEPEVLFSLVMKTPKNIVTHLLGQFG